LVAKTPDATVVELIEALTAHGRRHQPGLDAVSTAPDGLLTQKESLVAIERDTPQNLWRRHVLAVLLCVVDVCQLVFLDESFCTTSMTREYGCAMWGSVPGDSARRQVDDVDAGGCLPSQADDA
jgi:hypothetical protein